MLTDQHLKVKANIVHIKSWYSQAFNPHGLSSPPMVVDVIQHVMSNSVLP